VRTVKTTTITILAIGLLAGSAIGVTAQDEEPAAEPGTPAKVEGTVGQGGDVVQEPTETVVDGVLEVRDLVFGGEWPLEMDDPRVTGSVTVAVNQDVHKVSDFVDVVSTAVNMRLENEAGSWSGQGTSIIHAGGTIDQEEVTDLLTLILTGTGDYEGLTTYLIVDWTEDPPAVEGAIFAGEIPPFPELPAASAE
jgi:hypothetical protein